MPATVWPCRYDVSKFIGRTGIVKSCQHQSCTGHMRVVRQMLGGQCVTIHESMAGQQSSVSKFVRQMPLGLEQWTCFARGQWSIKVFQGRECRFLELVILAAQPVDQHGYGAIVAEPAQCPSDLQSVGRNQC